MKMREFFQSIFGSKDTNANAEPPFCINCRHYQDHGKYSLPLCRNPKVGRDLVTGDLLKVTCERARRPLYVSDTMLPPYGCDSTGDWFEKKESGND
jgi:hypothetical protein